MEFLKTRREPFRKRRKYRRFHQKYVAATVECETYNNIIEMYLESLLIPFKYVTSPFIGSLVSIGISLDAIYTTIS